VILLVFLSCRTAAGEAIAAGSASISQTRYVSNGIFVSRPADYKERIWYTLLFNEIRNLDDYCRWLNSAVAYKKEKNDSWADPVFTLDKKAGDCEDFAFLNSEALRFLGYETRVWGMHHFFGNHAVCVFRKDGYYFWFDNGKLRKTKAKTERELAMHFLSRYRLLSLKLLRLNDKTARTIYTRRDFASMGETGT
jgi:hypothetical protein